MRYLITILILSLVGCNSKQAENGMFPVSETQNCDRLEIVRDGILIATSEYDSKKDLIDSSKKQLFNKCMTVREAVKAFGPGYIHANSGIGSVFWGFNDGASIGFISWTEIDEVPKWIYHGNNELNK